MAKSQTLEFKRTISASPEAVFSALTSATALREWFCNLAIFEGRKGGRYYFAWNSGFYASGEVVKFDPGRKLALTWNGRGEPAPTTVKIGVAAKKNGTAVTVAHEGVGTGKKWAGSIEEITDGWEKSLENLQSVLETGADLRLTLRPLLGISDLGELNAEAKARLNPPVEEGVVIGAVMDGLGAHAAGLRKDDILVTVAKQKVWNFPSLASALQKHRAGDRVKVTYYRNGEKQTAEMELSRRPLPEIPATAADLASAIRRKHEAIDASLAQGLENVTEAEAEFRPEPGDWTVKEILAHLIHVERDNHAFFAEMFAGAERLYTDFADNSLIRTQATARAYGSLAALFDALKRSEMESVFMLECAPEALVAGKRTFWRLAVYQLLDDRHAEQHLGQINQLIAAARQK
jgi:uncharacterized protein YndB with AHSA1/START domain